MPARNGHANGVPSWVDLSTHDVEAAKEFYSRIFGWEWTGGDAPDGGTYWMATRNGKIVAGLSAQPPEMAAQGVPSTWNTYIAVDDAEATIAKAAEAGGRVIVPPTQVGNLGHVAFVMDPSGAAFGLWQAGEHKGAELVNEHGAIVWNEVYAPDTAGTIEFYGAVFGWTTGELPMPGGDAYTTFLNGDDTIGETVPPPTEQVPPHWHVWFAADDVDVTAAAATDPRATVLVPPTNTPMGKMASFHDPTGAVFSIITSPPQD